MDNSLSSQVVNVEPPSLESQPNKRRRKKSIVWEHFTVKTVSAGCTRACCKKCDKTFAYITGSKLAGTSHLKRHITLGICPMSRRSQEHNEHTPYPLASGKGGYGNGMDSHKRRYKAARGLSSVPFDQNHCNDAVARMIIRHEYPLQIVEQPGFIDFVRTLQPQFNIASFVTMQAECVGIYLREKHALRNILCGIPGRVNLTLDLWTSNQTLEYIRVTGHFIDADWKLHRRVLSVAMLPYPDKGVAFNTALVACLTDWNLESKVFSLTVDSSFSNETVVGNLRDLLAIKNPHLLNGQLVMENCFARVLGRLALDALGAMSVTVGRIRESVKYVKTAESREEKFTELKQRLQIPSTKDLVIDDLTKWDTTYHMLAAACELREVFSCLDALDLGYTEAPSMVEWRQAEILCKYLKLFVDAASFFTTLTYPTANTFFYEAWKIQSELTHAALSQDCFISDLTKPLQESFDRYWRETCLVLALAVVMDPRYKMKLVGFSFKKIYGVDAEAWIKVVNESLHDLFLEYLELTFTLPPNFGEEASDVTHKAGLPEAGVHRSELDQYLVDGFADFDVFLSENSSSHQTKSELDLYLDESLLPRGKEDFNVLSWWKDNEVIYPTLSKMARDILSIPITTVAHDSVHDTVTKKINSYQSSLRPVTLEALICGKDWLQYETLPAVSSPPEFSKAIVKIEI